ncbi:MAG: Sensor histidine kinase LiaS [bacterium ADurb.Bin425]|nr:MAG: Sensor histidine kinase LiaS [bacterium ADurb.Bin425]
MGLLSLGAGLVGLLLLAVVPRVIHGIAAADVALARSLLAANAEEQLQQRVSELEVSREASVESSASELRRIERDLHDGAQQRLVSLAMNLGMAKERLADTDDERAKEMVALAHDEAKQAIVELRDLVRGIHPAVLTDRGLDAAVSALIARCPVPVELHSDLPRRLPPAVEATAYFVVAEALTNVAKHSHARSALVRLVEVDDHLLIEVHDDGEIVGGALADLLEAMTTGSAVTDDGASLEAALENYARIYLMALALVPAARVTFRDLRRTLITADQQLLNGVNRASIESNFDNRGITAGTQGGTSTVSRRRRRID